MCLNAEKQLQAIDSVSLTLVLMPVGKASGIPVRVILKGIQCVCVVWCVCVCVCVCVCGWMVGGRVVVQVCVLTEPHVCSNRSHPSFFGSVHTVRALFSHLCFAKFHTSIGGAKNSLYAGDCKLVESAFIFNDGVVPEFCLSQLQQKSFDFRS